MTRALPSRLISSHEVERRRRRRRSVAAECSHDSVEHQVQILTHVFREEAQHAVAVLLEQQILSSVTTVCNRISEMLGTVQLHCDTGVGAQEIDFQSPQTVERDRQSNVEPKAALGFRQDLKATIKERFCRTPRSVCAVGIRRHGPGDMDEQRRERRVNAIPGKPAHAP